MIEGTEMEKLGLHTALPSVAERRTLEDIAHMAEHPAGLGYVAMILEGVAAVTGKDIADV